MTHSRWGSAVPIWEAVGFSGFRKKCAKTLMATTIRIFRKDSRGVRGQALEPRVDPIPDVRVKPPLVLAAHQLGDN
jgi:hypothetical protein